LVYKGFKPLGQVRNAMGRFDHQLIAVSVSHLHTGIFGLVAAVMIFIMGITMLKMDRGNVLTSDRL
jgi:hypothetical protein